MNSLLDFSNPAPEEPAPRASLQSRGSIRQLAVLCRDLLLEARALGLDLEDTIDAIRRHSDHSNNSN